MINQLTIKHKDQISLIESIKPLDTRELATHEFKENNNN